MSYVSAIILVFYGLALLIYPRKIQQWTININDAAWGKFNFFRDSQVSEGYFYLLILMGIGALAMGLFMIYHRIAQLGD